VTHLDVSEADVDVAIERIPRALTAAARATVDAGTAPTPYRPGAGVRPVRPGTPVRR
jgi:hypothetical protein